MNSLKKKLSDTKIRAAAAPVVLLIVLFMTPVHDLLIGATDALYFKNRNVNNLKHEMHDAWPLISKAAAPLGYTVSAPAKPFCEVGDPSLYRYYCVIRAEVKLNTGQSYPKDPHEVALKLQTFDALLKANGWEVSGNDFRKQSHEPNNNFYTALTKWGEIDIAYSKGSCYFEKYVVTTEDRSQDVYGYFDCAKDYGSPPRKWGI